MVKIEINIKTTDDTFRYVLSGEPGNPKAKDRKRMEHQCIKMIEDALDTFTARVGLPWDGGYFQDFLPEE